MHNFKSSSRSLIMIFGALTMVLSFQNCSQAKFQADDSTASAKASASAQGDDVSLSIPKSSSTTTTTTTGTGGSCPNMGSSSPNVSINISSGNNTQSNNFNMKAAEPTTRSAPSCANLDIADVKLLLEQIVVRQGGSEISLASLSGQYLTKDNSISFVAAASVSDVDRLALILQKSGHQVMNSKSEVQSIAVKNSAKRGLSLALSQRTSFEKGRTYQLSLKLSESTSIEDDGTEKCLLRPVLEIQ